jgi:branched-chain amino acid:cation transporter, LIVCS family
LVAVFAEFVQNELFKRRLNYKFCLLILLIVAFAFSNLGFMGIMSVAIPILMVCYPVLIVLTLLNLAYKLFGFKPVKIPVLITFIISLVLYLKQFVCVCITPEGVCGDRVV